MKKNPKRTDSKSGLYLVFVFMCAVVFACALIKSIEAHGGWFEEEKQVEVDIEWGGQHNKRRYGRLEEQLCLNGVVYYMGRVLAPAYKQDGTLYLCNKRAAMFKYIHWEPK